MADRPQHQQFSLARYLLLTFLTLLLLSFAVLPATAAPAFGVQVRHRNSGPTRELVVTITGIAGIVPKVLNIKNPDRIVIDLPGVKHRTNSSRPVKQPSVVQQIRIGSHPDKTRIVLDLSAELAAQYKATATGQALDLVIPDPGAGQTDPPPAPTKIPEVTPTSTPEKPTPSPKPTKTSTPTPTPAPTQPGEEHAIEWVLPEQTPSVVATSVPQSTPTAEKIAVSPTNPSPPTATVSAPPAESTPTQAPTPLPTEASSGLNIPPPVFGAIVDGVWVVRELIFDRLMPGKVPLLKISLSRPKVQIHMQKIDGKSYRIAIAGGQLSGPQLSLPHFPPADFDGFAVVSAKQQEGYVEIMVGVEPGTTIGAFVRGDQIWVKRL